MLHSSTKVFKNRRSEGFDAGVIVLVLSNTTDASAKVVANLSWALAIFGETACLPAHPT